MKVVILCGGEGLRFQNTFSPSSKVMAPIGDKPILWHIMNSYANYNHSDFVLCIKDNDIEISSYFNNIDEEWNIQIVPTGVDTFTGGRIKKIENLIEDEHFFVTYGDGLASVDLNALFSFHQSHGKIASLTAVLPTNQYGILSIENNNCISTFTEKPIMKDWVNAGFFVFNKKIFSYLKENAPLETSLFTLLTKEQQLMAYKHKGFWKSLDTFKDHQELNKLWELNKIPWHSSL